jgi:hypothetical protein
MFECGLHAAMLATTHGIYVRTLAINIPNKLKV